MGDIKVKKGTRKDMGQDRSRANHVDLGKNIIIQVEAFENPSDNCTLLSSNTTMSALRILVPVKRVIDYAVFPLKQTPIALAMGTT